MNVCHKEITLSGFHCNAKIDKNQLNKVQRETKRQRETERQRETDIDRERQR